MDYKFDDNGSDNLAAKAEIIPVVAKEDEAFLLHEDSVPDSIPMLPVRGNTIFPGVVTPIAIGRPSSDKLVREAEKDELRIACFTQVNPVDDPEMDDINEVGVIARVLRVIDLPNGDVLAVIQGTMKCVLRSILGKTPYYTANVELLDEELPISNARHFHMRVERTCKLFSELQENKRGDTRKGFNLFRSLKNIKSDAILVNYMCSKLDTDPDVKRRLFNLFGVENRLNQLAELLDSEKGFLESCKHVQNKARQEMDRQQHEYFLHQQMRIIQEELGGNNGMGPQDDLAELFDKAGEADWPEYVEKAFSRSVQKLRRTPPQTPDFTVEFNYAELLTELPWNKQSKDDINIARAQKVLDKDHYGMEKVKERILETIAVRQINPEGKGQIISNNIVKNGRNHGISIQGARNITVSNNLSYGNAGAGFYGNFYMSDVLISGNQLLDNQWGIYICPVSNVKGYEGVGDFRDITIQGNVLKRNREPLLLEIPDSSYVIK